MNSFTEPWAESMEALGIEEQTIPFILEHKEYFYLKKDGTIFPYLKEDIVNVVDVFRPCTFLPIFKELDIPFYEKEWLRKVELGIMHSQFNTLPLSRRVIGKYINWCRLKGMKGYTFKDSDRFFTTYNDYKNFHYIPKITFNSSYEDNNAGSE